MKHAAEVYMRVLEVINETNVITHLVIVLPGNMLPSMQQRFT